MKRVLGFICMIISCNGFAQEDGVLRGVKGIGKNISASGGKDTIGFEHRDDRKDSITISYRYLRSISRQSLDSSINDFDKYFPVPSTYLYLGNNGAAAKPLIFEPNLKPGWDAGFHAFDIYRNNLEDSRFYKTTRPFSMLSYQLASGKEQMIKAFHTQNPRPNLNAGFDFRLISAPGFFTSQNTNHNGFRLFGNYQGKRKRYQSYVVLLGNTIRAAENGGILNDSLLLNPNNKDRFSIDVNFGNSSRYTSNPFSTAIRTGNIYKDFLFFFRQGYDIGKKDSIIINDSTTEYVFYPKLRIQHSFTYNTQSYLFSDIVPDSAVYKNLYNIDLATPADTFSLMEKWKIYNNDLSLVQFPDTKNLAQFFLAGITLQNIKGLLKNQSDNYYNLILHGEYRNRTRNKLWDVQLSGEFYVNGLNAGNYRVHGSLSRFLNKKLGNISLFFTNVNRSPSFIFDKRSSFNLTTGNDFDKENITSFGAFASGPFINLGFRNHLLTNYTYFTDYFRSTQYSKPINLLQVFAEKKIHFAKRWNWYAEAIFQQTDGAAPIKVPLFFSRNRIAFEGKFYKNLNLSTGIELRYYSPYKANAYSPVLGQFIVQDTAIIRNLPDIAAFLHFRIKNFFSFIRAENLNTVSFANGFAFVNNNFAAPHQPTQGLIIRLGIQWWFVN